MQAEGGWKRLNAAHGTRQASGLRNESNSSSRRSHELQGVMFDVASAGNVIIGGVAQNAVQDAAISGGDDRRRTIPRVIEDDEDRAKQQRTEEDRTGDGISDRRRILDLRRDGWELENTDTVTQRCSVLELRPRVIRTRCTKWNQMESSSKTIS